MTDPITARQSIGWVWPCVMCGGCQTPNESPVEPTEIAYGTDWEPDTDGTSAQGGSIAALEVYPVDFDVSTLPSNAVAVIRFSWIAVRTNVSGAVDTQNYGVLLALRDENGLLVSSINALAGIAAALGTSMMDGVTDVSTPDNDTVRLEVTNGAQPGVIFFRWAISHVTFSTPIPPIIF